MLIEREEQLDVLLKSAQRAIQGHGSVVVIGGEAGIGKTSLLREFARQPESGLRVFWGGCEALFTPRSLGPLHDMAGAINARLLALFDQGVSQDRLFPALMDELQNTRSASVLIFEDVHWADNATLDLIKYLGRRVAFLRVVLILSLRTDEIDKDHPMVQVLGDLPSAVTTRIDLKPLSPAAVAMLVQQSHAPMDELYRVTNGNPFFVTELLAKNPSETAHLPASIRDAVWSRMSRLTPDERGLLEVMSVVPGAIDPRIVQALLGQDSDVLVERCLSLGLLVRDRQDFLTFRHELARQATIDRLSGAVKKSLHSKILGIIADWQDMPLSNKVHHAAAAGEAAHVLEFAPRAAAEAARLGAHQQAAAHLATALQHLAAAPRAQTAQLYEDWAFEAGLALGIDEPVFEARQKAILIWRELGRIDKVGLNLRLLARAHWYRGETIAARNYMDQALSELETVPPGPQLAMAYSARSQMHFLRRETDKAVEWGGRAIGLAGQLGEMEARIHALCNVGSAKLFANREGGKEPMEESLDLALKHGFHEHAARAYANFAEYAVGYKELELAEMLLGDGLAFANRHDLDSWTHYLVGRQAQLLMDQGKFHEAMAVAEGVQKLERLTLVMRLLAHIVLGKLRIRLGEPDGLVILQSAFQEALATGELPNIIPVRFGLIEAGWLSGDHVLCDQHLLAFQDAETAMLNPWELGELAVWWKRCNCAQPFPAPDGKIALPRRLELEGDVAGAAAEWSRLGMPYEAALSLAQSTGMESGDVFAAALSTLESIGARPAAIWIRERAKQMGMAGQLPKPRRGPYKGARDNPLNLTNREMQIFGYVLEGVNNVEIARRLSRSQRTVEHHVTALLSKLNARNRMELLLRFQSEPWLLPRQRAA